MCMSNVGPENGATAEGAGDAVGVSDRKWYVAFVGHNAEKASRDRLEQAGYEAFVASQKEMHYWRNGKRKVIEKVIITNYVFVRLSESERRQVVNLPYIKSFMIDKSRNLTEHGSRNFATISDKDMNMLKYMLHRAESPVEFRASFAKGDRVKVIRGGLIGVEGNVIEMKDITDKCIGINIINLGCATVHISPEDVVKVDN